MGDDLLKPASRFQEIYAGIAVLGTALLLGYFGVRGAIMYLHGSRAAPADPVACAIGILAGFVGGYLGVRMLFGWRENRSLVPTLFLFVAGLGAVAGAIWFISIDRSLHGSVLEQAQLGYWFGLIGLTAIILGWRRWRRLPPE